MDNLSLWEDTVKKSPGFSRVYNEYGIALIKKNKWKEGEKAFKKAINLGFILPPYINLSKVKMAEGNYEDGEKYLLYLIKLYPSNADLYMRLASYYIATSDNYKDKTIRYKKAIDSFLKAYELNNGYNLALYKVGQLYLHIGERRKAKRYLNKAIERNPKAFYVKGARMLVKNIERKLKK
jgi:tetratricopeptide (TPR) repeat protein